MTPLKVFQKQLKVPQKFNLLKSLQKAFITILTTYGGSFGQNYKSRSLEVQGQFGLALDEKFLPCQSRVAYFGLVIRNTF